jgi:hypothetical protein
LAHRFEVQKGVSMERENKFWGWLGTAVIAVISGGIGGAVLQHLSQSRDQDIKMVQVGLDILRTDPKTNSINPAREWAIRVVETYSGLPFNADDRGALINNGIRLISLNAQASLLSIMAHSSLTNSCEGPPELNVGDDVRIFAAKALAAFATCRSRHDGLSALIKDAEDAAEGRSVPKQATPP